MARNRIKLYWLLLLVLMYTATLVLSVGEAQARYETTVAQNVLVESQTSGITSNCLVSKNEAPLTVLVGELSYFSSAKVSFWMKSNGADAVGKLAWSVSDPDHAQYLKITMASGVDPIDSNMEIDLLKDAKMEITMTIQPTELARNTEHEAIKSNVLVTWGEEMWGTFQVILPEVKNEEDSESSAEEENNEDPDKIPGNDTTDENVEEPENSQPEGDNTGVTEPVAYDIIESNEEQTADNGEELIRTASADDDPETAGAAERESEENIPQTNPTETEETEASDPTEGSTGPTEMPKESSEPTESTENPTDSTEEPAETTEPTEPSEPEQTEVPIRLNTLRSFDPTEKLPVKISLTEDITAIRLGLWVVDPEKTEDPNAPVMDFDAFPDQTRFSLNQGESYYMMYDGVIAEFALQGMRELTVLLDFSHTELPEDEDMVLAMEAYSGEALIASCRTSTTPDARGNFRTVVHSLARMMTAAEDMAAAGEPSAVGILSRHNVLEYTLPLEWAEKDLEYSVQILTRAEDGSLIYNQVPLSETGLSAEYTNYNGVHNLVFRIGDTLPQAGTYRLNMKWSYEGICYAEQQTTFFINYSASTAYALGSQEVP